MITRNTQLCITSGLLCCLQVWDGELPDAKKLLVTIKGMMYREQYNFGISKIVPIPQARIPVIKFRYEPTMMDCDISFNKRYVNIYIVGLLLPSYLILADGEKHIGTSYSTQ